MFVLQLTFLILAQFVQENDNYCLRYNNQDTRIQTIFKFQRYKHLDNW